MTQSRPCCIKLDPSTLPALKVLKYPQLVIDGDWAQLYELTGVRTDAKRLEELRTRITEQVLTRAALESHGLQALLQATEL